MSLDIILKCEYGEIHIIDEISLDFGIAVLYKAKKGFIAGGYVTK